MAIPTVGNEGEESASDVTSIDITITVASAVTDDVLVALIPLSDSTGSGTTVSSVVLDPGGVDETAFTFEDRVTAAISAHEVVEAWHLVDPPTGTFTVRITASQETLRLFGWVGQISDVDQSDPLGAVGTASGNSAAPSVDVTTTADNSLVLAGLFHRSGDSDIVPGTDVTEVMDRLQNGQNGWAGYKEAVSSGAFTVDAATDSADAWAMLGVEVLAVAAAAERRPEMVRPVMQPRPIRQLRI